ncbi:MAG: hypothetical protein RIC16_06860 [Rhodospirillales bacterium]
MDHSPYLDQIRDLETLEQIVREYEAEEQSGFRPSMAGIRFRGGNVRVMVSPALMSRAS